MERSHWAEKAGRALEADSGDVIERRRVFRDLDDSHGAAGWMQTQRGFVCDYRGPASRLPCEPAQHEGNGIVWLGATAVQCAASEAVQWLAAVERLKAKVSKASAIED